MFHPEHQPDEHKIVVGSGAVHTSRTGFSRFWRGVIGKIWPAGASRLHKIVVVAAGIAIVGGIAVTSFLLLRPSSEPLSVATEQTAEGIKIDTDGDGIPDTIVADDGTVKPDEPAANNEGSQGGGTGQSSGGSGSSGGTGGGGSGGGSGGGGGSGESSPLVCPAFPAFPDASCTGWEHTGVTLHDCDGNITTPNSTYDSCRFRDGVSIKAANVTIKRSLIEGLVEATYLTDWDFQNLTLIDVEIDNSDEVDPYGQAAIGSNNYTCIRCDIHGTGRGANMGVNVRIEDSYLHDFVYIDGAHQSAIGSNGGNNYQIIHNNIECNSNNYGCSGALVMYGDFDPVDNILIEKNLFNTDGGYCTYGGSTGESSGKAYPHGTNIRYLNNRFGKKYASGCGSFGPVAAWEYNSGNVWSGNAWHDGSGAINP